MEKSAASSSKSPWLLLMVAAGALALGGALSLWIHYGTVVFFETIRTGFAACFG